MSVIAAEAGVGHSRQVRLENLVKVFLGTRCFPMRRHLAFNLLAVLSAPWASYSNVSARKQTLSFFSKEVFNEDGG